MKLGLLIAIHISLYTGLFWLFPYRDLGFALGIGGVMIWISIWDMLTFEIPDSATALLALLAAAWLWFARPVMIWDHIAGGVIWPLLFWGIAALFERLRGEVGLGFGDVKLMLPIGLLCGALASVHVVLIASLAGVLLMGVNGVLRRDRVEKQALALGPFLVASGWAVWLALG